MPEDQEPVDLRASTRPEPFKVVKGAEDTGGDYVRIKAVLPPSDLPQQGLSLKRSRWLGDTSREHLHPRQEEHIKVLSGQLRIALNGYEQRLTEGEEITLPPKVPHQHWNATERPARIVIEHRPALQSELIFETVYQSAQDGNANEEGFPSFLQVAVVQNEYPDHTYTTALPVIVQKGLFMVLGPLGRLLGYRTAPSQGVSSQDAPPLASPSVVDSSPHS